MVLPDKRFALNRSRSLTALASPGGAAHIVSWSDDPLVKAAVALAPETVLRTLASVPAGDVPPFLTVRLAGGHVLEGGLVTVGADRGDDVVVLADPQTGRLGYALLSGVVAVELRDPGPFRDLLTGGRLPLPQAGEPVTRLALQREFGLGSGFPVEVDWAALAGSGPLLGNLAVLLRGQRAWARVGTLRVEHQAGSPLSVLPVAGGLAVQADLSAALPRALPGELVTKISALL